MVSISCCLPRMHKSECSRYSLRMDELAARAHGFLRGQWKGKASDWQLHPDRVPKMCWFCRWVQVLPKECWQVWATSAAGGLMKQSSSCHSLTHALAHSLNLTHPLAHLLTNPVTHSTILICEQSSSCSMLLSLHQLGDAQYQFLEPEHPL